MPQPTSDSDVLSVLRDLRTHPRIYLVDERYETLVGFLVGYDLGAQNQFLDRFIDWYGERNDNGPIAPWVHIAGRVAGVDFRILPAKRPPVYELLDEGRNQAAFDELVRQVEASLRDGGHGGEPHLTVTRPG